MSVLTSAPGSGDLESYEPPEWVPQQLKWPRSRLRLANLPTPIRRWALPLPEPPAEAGPKLRHDETSEISETSPNEVWIKRDDFSGCETSGNKIRKLDFLLAEALSRGCDSVITVGGIQSNHCRATAVAARQLGLEPHVILRTTQPLEDPGLTGNLLVARMVGAQLHLVSETEFSEKGGWTLVCELQAKLEGEGRRPFGFPSGGSNSLGTWGYIEAVRELQEQVLALGLKFERIYFACGSGGTAAGLALGVHYSGLGAAGCELVGLGVDDSPAFFHKKIDGIFAELGVPSALRSEDLLRIEDCVGEGYARSSAEELAYLHLVAKTSGVVLDPVYSGKAALGAARDLARRPVRRALFIHTGGLLGLFAKEAQLAPLLRDDWE